MKQYIIEAKPKEGSMENYVHDEVNGAAGGIMSAEIGERGWLWFYLNDGAEDTFWGPRCLFHRLHTSTIQNITETDDAIVIETRNTFYTLRERHDEEEVD